MRFKPGVIEITDRSKEIIEYLQSYMKEYFHHSCQGFQCEIEQQGDQIWQELKRTVDEVLEQTICMQKQGQKADIGYLVFSFLRSSMFQENLEIRVETLDDSFYLDMQESAAYYRPSFLQKRYQEDIARLCQQVEKKFVRAQANEMFLVKEQYISYYESFLYQMIESLAGLIMKEVIGSSIRVTDDFRIIYGEFMDKASVICTKENSNEIFSHGSGGRQ